MSDKEDHQRERARLIAAHLELPDDLLPHVDEHLGDLVSGEAPVIWIQGQNCSGCTVSLMNSDHFNPHDFGSSKLSLRYQPNMMSAEGFKAIDVIEETEKEYEGRYLVVLEGSVPTGDGEGFCTFGLTDGTRQLMGRAVPNDRSVFDWLTELIPGAEAVLAVGNCAAYGGIPMMESQITGATSATDVVEAIDCADRMDAERAEITAVRRQEKLKWKRPDAPETEVKFADLGLADDREYLVFEFWTQTFLGKSKGSFKAPAQNADSAMQVFAIREARPHPWVLSTTRHISQGGVSLLDERWDAGSKTLSGKSAVVVGDPYVLTVHLPQGFRIESAEVGGEKVESAGQTEIATVRIVPSATKTVEWKMTFAR